MDMWKYYDITHRDHVICNPTSDEKLDQLVDLFAIGPGRRVLDIACGKAELLIRLAIRHGADCLGIDRSPYFLREAEERRRERAPNSRIDLLEMDGAAFRPDGGDSFQVTSCLGASFVFGGYEATLRALTGMTSAGGWVVSGEPYWRMDPDPDYLAAIGCSRETFGTHYANVRTGEALGLDLVYTLVSSQDDFDRYEGLQWRAADAYRRAHPEDPDLPELGREIAKSREGYLKWGRECLGWAIYVFRRRPDRSANL